MERGHAHDFVVYGRIVLKLTLRGMLTKMINTRMKVAFNWKTLGKIQPVINK